MPTKAAKKEVVKPTGPTKADLDYINKEFPDKNCFRRRIHHLWDQYFRVNYHLECDLAQIPLSYFVECPRPKPNETS